TASISKSFLATRAKSRWSIFFARSARWNDHSASEISKTGFLSSAGERPANPVKPRPAARPRELFKNERRLRGFMVELRKAGHGVFVDAGPRGKEARDEIVGPRGRAGRYDDAPHRDGGQSDEVRPHVTHGLLGFDLDQVIEPVAADKARRHAQGGRQVRRHLR